MKLAQARQESVYLLINVYNVISTKINSDLSCSRNVHGSSEK